MASLLPFIPVILGMGQNMTDIDPLSIVVDCYYQSGFVPTDVKNGEFANLICAGEHLMQFCNSIECTVLNYPIPSFKTTFAGRVFLCEIQ